MHRVRSFKPIADPDAEVLILGSMPGPRSLAAREYYAHPQNAFWRIAAALLRFDPASSYASRVRALTVARVALWDVLHSCVREGALDTGIESDSQIPNDFREFFRVHGRITHVFFNGAKAEACFRRHVLPELERDALTYVRLPSTSPANASLSFARKLSAWRVILRRNRALNGTARKRRLQGRSSAVG